MSNYEYLKLLVLSNELSTSSEIKRNNVYLKKV